ncbi:hypothetical protein [Micromonospora sp. NPDC051296]|uniref:hypothetical protein n=1 Tax=Micromonospora sp. NPDC051296 TaxID=3155046 RepID=UPI00343740E8
MLDFVTWLLVSFAGFCGLACLAFLVWYGAVDWPAQVEGTLQAAVEVMIALSLAAALAFTGLASVAAYVRYRRKALLILAGLTLVASCATPLIADL